MEMNTSNQADRSSTNLSDNLLSEILMRLQADENSKWKDINTSKLKESLTDRVSIDKLRHIDLNIIISALSEQEELPKPAFWKSMKKQEKIVFAPYWVMILQMKTNRLQVIQKPREALDPHCS